MAKRHNIPLRVPDSIIYGESRKKVKLKPEEIRDKKLIRAKLNDFITHSTLDLAEGLDTIEWIKYLLKEVRCPDLLKSGQIERISTIAELFIELNDELLNLQLSLWSKDITKRLEEEGLL